MKITIKEKEYNIKNTIRSVFVFEKMMNKPFAIESIFDTYVYFYAMILANNPDSTLLLDEFIDECDDKPEIFAQINEYLQIESQKNKLLDPKQIEAEESKKK